MKRKSLLILILISAFSLVMALSGCNSFFVSENRNPAEIIQDVYGNEEFTISFYSEETDTPIADMSYSANSMPTLPTPTRVGYIFEGWYLDRNYTTPYVDGILYLYMTDITLYAKWSEEELVQDGVYDIEIEGEVLSDTVRKGVLTDSFGGYGNFVGDIIAEETYIEKTDGKLLLKIQYDSGSTVSFGSDDVYTVSLSNRMDSSVYIESIISSDAETVKTIYLNIDDFELSDTIYLDIIWWNWKTDGLSEAQREQTRTRFTVALRISRFIGLSQTFVNTDVPLEDGYYLARTYFSLENNSTSMMEDYNPVYSYIIAENGNYTLVKPFMPYVGLLGETASGTLTDYYSRLVAFAPMQLYYDIELPTELEGSASLGGSSAPDSDYYPSYYNGGTYGTFTVEYHADTGRYYSLFDLGSDLTKQYMVMSAATGYMEAVFGNGSFNQILFIDTEHILKLASVDYTPLEGDAYQYEEQIQYYPGEVSDLNERNMTYTATQDYGLNTNMINFFWSAASINSSQSSRTMYSHKITVTPTVSTSATAVSDARYSIAHFNVNAQVYGYDAASGENLYADSMTVATFGDSGLRETLMLRTGKSLDFGESINLVALYAEKVDSSYDFSNVNYTVYPIKDGNVDYSRTLDKSNVFIFDEEMAVLFTSEQDDGKKTTLIWLTEYVEPSFTVDPSFDTEKVYTVGDNIDFPDVAYQWGNLSGNFIGNHYDSEPEEFGVDPTRVAVFSVEDGIYFISYANKNSTNDVSFYLTTQKAYVVYEIRNSYGEVSLFYLEINSQKRAGYRIQSESGEILTSDYLTYDDDGRRERIQAQASYTGALGVEELVDILSDHFYLYFDDGSSSEMTLSSVVIKKRGEDITVTADKLSYDVLLSELNTYDYAYINFFYASEEGDTYSVRYVWKMSFGGKQIMEPIIYDELFTGYEYKFTVPDLISSSGVTLASGSLLRIQSLIGDTANTSDSTEVSVTRDGNRFTVNFLQSRTYRFVYSYGLRYDENGQRIFGDVNFTNLTFCQDIEVKDGTGEVTITYLTDSEHPFKEDIPYQIVENDDGSIGYAYTITYTLGSNIVTIGSSVFELSEDELYGWAKGPEYTYQDTTMVYNANTLISDFIGAFNTSAATLYAIWDEGIQVTYHIGEDTIVEIYHLETGSYKGNYRVDLNLISVPEIAGYVFVGWTGGFLGNEIVTLNQEHSAMNIYTVSQNQDWDVYAVYRKILRVTFVIDQTYSNSYFGIIQVLEGDAVPEAYRAPQTKTGYRFVGWYMQGDETQTILDLDTFTFSESVTLVAKFEATGE